MYDDGVALLLHDVLHLAHHAVALDKICALGISEPDSVLRQHRRVHLADDGGLMVDECIALDGGVVLMDDLLMIFRYRNILCPARQQAQGCQQEESEFFNAVLYLRLTSI